MQVHLLAQVFHSVTRWPVGKGGSLWRWPTACCGGLLGLALGHWWYRLALLHWRQGRARLRVCECGTNGGGVSVGDCVGLLFCAW